jgi:hypothetical protein
MTDHVSYSPTGAVSFVGPKAVNVFRMITLANGLASEIKGLRLTRGRTCFSIIKKEYGLSVKGAKAAGVSGKQHVLNQFLPLVEEAKAAIPKEVRS